MATGQESFPPHHVVPDSSLRPDLSRGSICTAVSLPCSNSAGLASRLSTMGMPPGLCSRNAARIWPVRTAGRW